MVKMNKKALVLVLLLFTAALFVGGKFVYGLFFIGLFLVLTSYLAGRSIFENLVNLTWEVSFKAVTGDRISLKTDFYNAGFVPVPYLKVNASLPKRLAGEEQKQRIYSIMPEMIVTMSRDFLCRHKGVYKVGIIETEFEDILGIFKWKKIFNDERFLIVYPKVYLLKHLDVPLRQQFGTVAVKHNAYEDFASTKDIRKYVLGDSFKKMHWKVTAHRGDFFVRNVEINASADLNVFLDLYDYGLDEEIAFDIEEKGAECAVSIIRYALSHSMSVNFTAKGDELVNLSAKRADRFNQFLDVISLLSSKGDMPIADLIRKEVRKLAWDATVVVITPCIDKAASAFLSLKTSGIEFVVVYLCKDSGVSNENIEMLRNNDFKVFVVGLEDDIRQVLGGHYEK
ncbi:MAG: hypothetical protein APF77_04560 [Clostridia bacterium BRH_c25]|nr:MAG: hypothetical protein APF77_04560 [Clostridia bacterium BRH_c25]